MTPTPPPGRRSGGDAAFLGLIALAASGGLIVLAGAALGSLAAGHGLLWPGTGQKVAALRSLVTDPGRPAAAYPDRAAADVPGPVAVWAATAALAVAVAATAMRLYAAITGRFGRARQAAAQERYRRRERATSSAWADRADVADLIDDGDPLRWPLGRHGRHDLAGHRYESMLLMAPTGAGKTTRYVVPHVLRLCRAKVPKMVATIKGDAVWLTHAAATAAGPVWTFAPGGLGGLPLCRWNPLGGCRDFQAARTMATWLSNSQRVSDTGAESMRFWDQLGRTMLAPMLYAAASTGQTLAAVVRWVRLNDEDEVQRILDNLVDNPADNLADGPDGEPGRRADVQDARAMWAATRAREPRQKSSVFGTAEVILAGFDHPLVRELMTGADADPDVYSPAKLLDQAGTLYIAPSKTRADELAAVIDAMTAQLLHEVENRSNARGGLPIAGGLAIVLEEAANIARFRNLPYVASGMRGMGVLLMSVWQDEGQIEDCYGRGSARTIMSNHLWQVFLPGSTDPDTLTGLSKRVGTYLRPDTSWSSGGPGSYGSSSTRWAEEPAATTGDLHAMGPDQAIALHGGRKPIRVTTRPWYANPADRRSVDPAVAGWYDQALAPAAGKQARR